LDYNYRGDSLLPLSLFEYTSVCRLKKMEKASSGGEGGAGYVEDEAEEEAEAGRACSIGRRANAVAPFDSAYAISGTHQQVRCSLQSLPALGRIPAWPQQPPQGEGFSRRWRREANAFAEFALAVFFPWPAPSVPDRFVYKNATGHVIQPYEYLALKLQEYEEEADAACECDCECQCAEDAQATTFCRASIVAIIESLATGRRVTDNLRHANARWRGRWGE
jgi:hypothetical protein